MDRKVSHGKTYLLLKNTLNGFLRPSVAVMVGKYTDPATAKSWEPLFTCDGAFRFVPLKGGEATETVGSYAAVLSPMQFASQDKPAELFLAPDGAVLAD